MTPGRFAGLALLIAAACSSSSSAPVIRHLDRPTDVSFGCVATVPPGDTGLSTAAFSPTSCAFNGVDPTVDAGVADAPPGGATSFQNLAFILEPLRGAVSVANTVTGGFVDADRFTPGLNGLNVGRQPLAVAISGEGCFAVTANFGSCDLSRVSVVKAYLSRNDAVTNLPVTSNGGTVTIRSRPTMVVTRPGLPTLFAPKCEGEGKVESQVYVSFASCHLVARVDVQTGAIIDGILSPPGEAPRIVGPDVTCPDECSGDLVAAARPQEEPSDGGVGPVDAGVVDAPLPLVDAAPLPALATQPSALALEQDGIRVYAGGPTTPGLLIADLDSSGAPTSVSVVELEGGVGISRMTPSGPVTMTNSNSGPVHRYVYAIATDQSVRVIDVTPNQPPTECDTQIDRRYLHGISNTRRAACFPVGDPNNPPRRVDVSGPGIRLPRDVLPLDVAFIRAGSTTSSGLPARDVFNGVFAFITAIGPVADPTLGRGVVYVVNVDDDNYPDREGSEDYPTDIGLAMPHSLRDNTINRTSDGLSPNSCVEEDVANGSAPLRFEAADLQRPSGFLWSDTGGPDDLLSPNPRRVPCLTGDPRYAPYFLEAAANPAARREAVADIERVSPQSVAGGTSSNEAVVVIWEGPLAFDNVQARRRGGKLTTRSSAELDLSAPGGLLCSLGGQSGDIVQLLGCDSDAECGLGELCVIHPDTPSGINGMCALEAGSTDFIDICRDLLVSERRYTAVDLFQDHAVLAGRPDVLPASPLEGCVPDPDPDPDPGSEQCKAIEEEVLTRVEKAREVAAGTLPRHRFACERDVAMGGPRRCLYSCGPEQECNAGAVCVAERCMLAPIPAPVCLERAQRYELRAGDSFIVLTSAQSFGHREVVDPGTGRCVENPDLSPLINNRIHRVEAPCPDPDTVDVIAPNPCQIPNLFEPVKDAAGNFAFTRPSYGMRIRGPSISVDISDIAVELAAFPGVLLSNIPHGYALRFDILGGFTPYSYALSAPLPERIRPSPDGSLWVVDSGDSSGSLTRGQVFRMTTGGVDTMTNRLR